VSTADHHPVGERWRRGGEKGSPLLHPARIVVLGFVAVALLGSLLLSLPFATETGDIAPFTTASFTAVSAVTVTGLVVVDTSGHWSVFGELVILALVQVGGFGITALASLLGLLVFRRLGLRNRLTSQVELNENDLGGVREIIVKVFKFFLVMEVTGFILLTGASLLTTDAGIGDAAWFGLFHSISAFNNAGFSTFSDSLVGFAGNPLVLVIVSTLVIIGGIGFPVVLDIARRRTGWRWWTLHTRLTVSTTVVLLVAGALAIGVFEWTNPDTFGTMPVIDRITNASFASITPRTAGFNSIDYGLVEQPTLVATQVLMFIGGGSGSAAGGIKVTTFALLAFVIWSEMRGEDDVNAFGRRVDHRGQRQAVTIALLGVGLAVIATLTLAAVTTLPEGSVAFEALSALNTVGLSTGITPGLPVPGQVLLVVLMLVGRLGPVTVGTALVLRHHKTLYRYPEGRPLLG
jgi:trk system potassium uptake protein